ncbi:MAG: lipocalin family protein [Desulfobacterales bacterium]
MSKRDDFVRKMKDRLDGWNQERNSYQYAMVVGPRRSFLWILSRQKKMDQKTLGELVAKAEQLGFDTEKLIYVDQNRPNA